MPKPLSSFRLACPSTSEIRVQIQQTELAGLLLIEPDVRGDERGFFFELWQQERYRAAGLPQEMAQDNLSRSARGVLRGLHFQNPNAQGKLVTALEGAIFDVAVDLRHGSPTFGRWFGAELSAANHRQLFVPVGFAHGFCVLSEAALVHYKCTAPYDPASELTVAWNDPQLAIAWPCPAPTLSPRDAQAPPLAEIPVDRLFNYS
jgi:dTDP-4-dehydrorhamnose 3,5-epimerase